jgi:hypothetical protein
VRRGLTVDREWYRGEALSDGLALLDLALKNFYTRSNTRRFSLSVQTR